MKINRKTVLSTAAVLGVAALIAGGTIAYFTDKAEPKTNTLTVGKVDITLYESQLHRENSGIQGTVGALASDANYCDYTQQYPDVNYNRTGAQLADLLTYKGMRYCTPNTNADNTEGISAVTNGHTRTGFNNANRTWGYSDATIIDDAENKFATYWAAEAGAVVPGQWLRKFSYVKTAEGSSDSFVLIRYMVPEDLVGKVTLKIPGTPFEEDEDADTDGTQPYFYAVNYDENAAAGSKYSAYTLTNNGVDDYTGYTVDIEDETTHQTTTYRVYAAVTRQALKGGEMTFWSPINAINIDKGASQADFEGYENFGVIVDAEAIQAFTFADAIEAINKL